MGFAASALLGAALAEKPRYGIAFCGDGSFMMNPQILVDAVEHHVRGMIVIFDNRRMAAITGQHPRLGWLLPASDTPIQPLVVGTNAAAMWLAAALDRQGLWVPAIRPPTVPQGTARLRIPLSASHSMEDVDALADGLARAAGRMQ